MQREAILSNGKTEISSFEEEKTEELYGKFLLLAKVPKKDGNGNEYPVIGHMVGLEGKVIGDQRKLLPIAGF